MNLASFFIASVALHLTLVLAYPGSRATLVAEHFVPVTILSFGEAGGSTGDAAPAAKTKITPEPVKASAPAITTRKPERLETAMTAVKNQQAAETVPDVAATMGISRPPLPGVTESTLLSTSASDEESQGIDGAGIGMDGRIGSFGGLEFDAPGSGPGKGNGGGHVAGSPAVQSTQVSFRHTPPPNYPDAAREDGKEGRVLLRVLVGEDGKSKIVEINLSSGNRILDQAAAEAIKSWRFSPASYGSTPVASWVKIPVDFRLTEAKE